MKTLAELQSMTRPELEKAAWDEVSERNRYENLAAGGGPRQIQWNIPGHWTLLQNLTQAELIGVARHYIDDPEVS